MIRNIIVFLFLYFIPLSVVNAELKIVVSIPPVYNITKAITGDTADIVVLIPSGTSPHLFSPKPSQIGIIAKADYFIQVGVLEFWAEKLLKASDNTKLEVITLTDGMELIAEDDHGHEENNEERLTGNPHIWLDPLLVKDISKKIYDKLKIKYTGNDLLVINKNYLSFNKELDELNKYLAGEIKNFRIKELVSFHPAWAYFERRYALIEVGVIQASPGKEPSINEIQNIIEQIKKYRIKTIFAEPQLSRKSADVIASEAGVSVLILDPIGQTDSNGKSGYINLIKTNFEIMKKAMK